MSYAKLASGLLLPETIVRQEVSAMLNTLPLGNHGAYRTASAANKNTIGWSTSTGSADADTLADLPTLRRQSRDLVRNEALPAGAIGTMVLGVVGQGIVPQSRIDADFLGLSDEQASKWSRAAERIFNHMASKPTFDSEAKLNFWQMQRLVYRSSKESGDAFALRRYIERPGKKLGVCVQIVEADRIATPLSKAANPAIRSGIEADENGAPLRYHIMQQHPGETLLNDTKFTEIPAFDRAGNPLMLPIMTALRPGQTRGVPILAPVIELFKQLGRYTEAEVTAAVISGMFAVFVTSPGSTSPLPGGIPGMVGGTNVVPNGNGLQKLQSGMIVDLAPGEEIKTAEATRPNTAFEAFCNGVLSQAGAALGVPRQVLLKDYNASYSAARAALQDAWRFFMIERDDLAAQFCQPVWDWVITEAVARNLLDAPGFFDDPMIRDAYLAATWIGPAMASLDPGKDAKAATEWHTLGIKSKQDISNEQGLDFDSTLAQRAREKKQEEAAGLILLPTAIDTKTTNNNQNEVQQ